MGLPSPAEDFQYEDKIMVWVGAIFGCGWRTWGWRAVCYLLVTATHHSTQEKIPVGVHAVTDHADALSYKVRRHIEIYLSSWCGFTK